MNDHRICSVSGHENMHSVQVCDHPAMSAACDKTKAMNTLAKASDSSSTTASRSAGIIHTEKENVLPTDSHLDNVTLNVINKLQKRKRLSPQLD